MECPICYDSLHAREVVCVPCGHLFHETCLHTHIKQRERDCDYDPDDEDECMVPDCPTCRTPIRYLTQEMMEERVPCSLRSRIYPAIRKVYLSPPTADEAERMREMDQLWSRVERMQKELEECTGKVAAADTKCKKAESRAIQLRNKVKELTDMLQKEQQRQIFLQSAVACSVEQRQKAEASYSQAPATSAGVACATIKRSDDDETRQLIAQVEQITQSQSEATTGAGAPARVPTSNPCSSLYQTYQASPRFTPYARPSAYSMPRPVAQVSGTPYMNVQAGPSSYVTSSGSTQHPTPSVQRRATPTYTYFPAFHVPPPRQQTVAAIGNAQLAGFQNVSRIPNAPSAYAVPISYPSTAPSTIPTAVPMQPQETSQRSYLSPTYPSSAEDTQPAAPLAQSAPETEQYAQEQIQPQAQPPPPRQQQQHAFEPANQVRPYGTTIGANGRSLYVYVTGDGRLIYSERMM